MAGAALTTQLKIVRVDKIIGTYPIKSAEVVNEGDLVALDSNSQVVVAGNAGGLALQAIGFAFFDDEHGAFTPRTGVAGLTVKCGIAQSGRIGNFAAGLTDGGLVYLDVAPAAGADNYTQTRTTTDASVLQIVGYARGDTEIEVDPVPTFLIYESTPATVDFKLG